MCQILIKLVSSIPYRLQRYFNDNRSLYFFGLPCSSSGGKRIPARINQSQFQLSRKAASSSNSVAAAGNKQHASPASVWCNCNMPFSTYSAYLSRHIRLHSMRTLRSTTTTRLSESFASTAFAKRAFRCSAPATWNSLPRTVTDNDSLGTFKSRLKQPFMCYGLSHCMAQYFVFVR